MTNQRVNNTRTAVILVLLSCVTAMFVSMSFIAGQDLSRSSTSSLFIETANDYFRDGNARYQERDFHSAVVAYQEAIHIYPEYGFAWTNLALSLSALDPLSVDASLAAYEQAIVLMPHRSRTHYSLGVSLMRLQAYEEATTWLQMATQRSPRFPAALFQLALCHQQTGQTRQALQAYQRVLRVDPSFTAARVNYCYLLLVQQNEPGAEACYEEVLRSKPNNVAALVQLAKMAQRRRNLNWASQLFARVLSMDYYDSVSLFSQAVLQRRPVSRALLHKYLGDHFDSVAFHYDATMRQHDYEIPYLLLKASLSWLVSTDDAFLKCLKNQTSIGDAVLPEGEQGEDTSKVTDDAYDEACLLAEFSFDDKLVLDLGSGTGLLCEVYRLVETPVSMQFYGVDISEAMVGRAKARECYNRVVHSEAEEFLGSLQGESFDVILAAETLHHMGALDGVFQRSTQLITPGGLLSFSIDIYDSAPSGSNPDTLSPLSTPDSGSGGSKDKLTSATSSSETAPGNTTIGQPEDQPPAPSSVPPGSASSHSSSLAASEEASGSAGSPRRRNRDPSKKKRRDKNKKSSSKASSPSTASPGAEQYFIHPLTNTFVHDLKYLHTLIERHGLTVLHLEAVDTPASVMTAPTSDTLDTSNGDPREATGAGSVTTVPLLEDLPAVHSYIFVLQAPQRAVS